jgi:hypothetical protein
MGKVGLWKDRRGWRAIHRHGRRERGRKKITRRKETYYKE